MTKIKKWLESRGYRCDYKEYETWRHNDSFHKGCLFSMELYSVSNGMYIRFKTSGKGLILLYKDEEAMKADRHCMLDFTQGSFIERAKGYFPDKSGGA